MNFFADLAQNRVLEIAILCWLAAQILKVLFDAIRNHRFSFERMVGAGGMPSSHSSTVCGLTVAVGRTYGLASPIFAIAFVIACIVMYDATGVRRAAGEQAKVLNRMMQEHDWAEAQRSLKEFLGHTPMEVFAGAILGIVLAFLIPVA
ncbi:MAG: divergent PAP2 family protein [Candidatus Merdivicinus sp.]|jgi:acid phosphatase family membrane protein YuiD